MFSNIDDFRPIPFYFINTTEPQYLDRKATRAAMENIKRAGFGGALLFNKPPTGFGMEIFLEKPWFDAIGNFLDAADELGLKIWINDGWDYPPGDAAGRIEKSNPDLYQRRLARNADGSVSVVKVDWGFPAFEEPESSELFLKFVYEEYYKRFKKYFGNTLAGFFSDADNRRMNSSNSKAFPEKAYFPWSRNFDKIFKERFGYEITEYLPQITDLADIPQADDYWELASELYHNWFKNNYLWCKAHGVKYSFHTSDTGPLHLSGCRRTSVYTEGSTLKLAANCDYPGTDHELLALDGGTHYDTRYFVPTAVFGGEVTDRRYPKFNESLFDVRAKYTSSAAILYDAPRALCEMFAATNWGATADDLRRIASWQIIQGINFIIPHAIHHRFFGSTKYFAPPEFYTAFPGESLKELNDYLAKYCMICAQGAYIPEAVVIDPADEMWRGKDSGKLFEIIDTLNKQNYNFIVVPRSEAAKFNLPIFDPYAESTPKLPASRVKFSGGTIASMIRTLDDGSNFLVVANIWSDDTLQGTLTFEEKSVEIELAPGEIAVINGPYEEFRVPAAPAKTAAVPAKFNIKWHSPNVIPCHFKTLKLTIAGNVDKISLLVPEEYAFAVPGAKPVGKADNFGDVCNEFQLPTAPGSYTYELPDTEWHTPVMLKGEFDVQLKANGKNITRFVDYDMKMTVPEELEFILSPRRTEIAAGSWADQGQPFYSGSAELSFEAEFDGGMAALNLPAYSGSAAVAVDGQQYGRVKVFTPFRFMLGKTSPGKHKISLMLTNTMANQLECYRAPGGLIETPVVEYF